MANTKLREVTKVETPEVAAKGYIETIEKSDGGPSLELALNSMGAKSLQSAKLAQTMMEEVAKKALPEMDSESPLAKIVTEANQKTMALNPNTVTQKLLYRLPIPFLKDWMIKTYINDFQSQNDKVKNIFEALDRGKDNLLLKMEELNNQYINLTETDKMLVADIETAKQIQTYLESIDVTTLERSDKIKYELASNKVNRKIVDLTTIRSAIQQFFVSINQTMETNSLLNGAIESIQTVGPMVLTNAIMIHSAINEQKQVAEAANAVRNTLSAAMIQNAEMIEGNAQLVADMYSTPVLAIESLKTSYDKLSNAVSITHQAMLDSTKNAKEVTAQLEHMQEEFKGVEVQLQEAVKADEQLKRLSA